MAELIKAKEPFQFYSRLHLLEMMGLKASNLRDLLELIKTVPDSCIYHHTHRFLQQHQYLSPEPPNDFAHWVSEVLGDNELGEQLASVDTIQFSTMRGLRERLAAVIENHMQNRPSAQLRFAGDQSEFYFIKSMSFIFPTHYVAHDLQEFAAALQKVSVDSIYYHIFESRLRLEKETNDFSFWIETSFGDASLARQISRLDPYTYTMEDLRKKIVNIIESKIT